MSAKPFLNILKDLKHYPASLTVLALIVYLSFFHPSQELINQFSFPNFDKFVHFGMYAGFCCVIWLEYFISHEKVELFIAIIGAVVLPIIFSGMVEIAQEVLTRYRGGDWYDFIANVLGVCFAALFSWTITRRIITQWSKKKN